MFLLGLALFLLGARGILWVLDSDIESAWFVTKLIASCICYCGGAMLLFVYALNFAARGL